MTSQPWRLPKVDHRPLHSVAQLALVLPQAQRLLLPDRLSAPVSPWTNAVMVSLIALILGWQLLLLPEFQVPPAKWTVIAAISSLAGAALWWVDRQRLRAGGWLVDFAQSRIVPVRQDGEEPIVIVPNEYSLGCYVCGGANNGAAFTIELRHVRRGPVAQLSTVPVAGYGKAFERELGQLDLCVDMLAQRLGIRRSGEPLLKSSRRPSAS